MEKDTNFKTKMKKVFTPLFIYGAIGTAVFSIWSMLLPKQMGETMYMIQGYLAISLGWFIMALPVVFMGILIFLGVHPKYRNYKLGGPNAEPDYSTFSWLAMLFTASIGVGIIYFAVNGPIFAYLMAPTSGTDANTVYQGVKKALGISMFQWGPHVWSIFGVAGLTTGYFAYRHGTKFLPGEPLLKTFKNKKWSRPIAFTMNVIALVCSAMTIATTLGLGAGQLVKGIEIVKDITLGQSMMFLALFVLFVITAVLSILPTGKGMRIIGDLNVFVALGILVFSFVFGPTRLILETIMQSINGYIEIFASKSFEMFLFSEKQAFLYEWEVSSIQWWLAWTPFMGVFVSSISRGRTLKEFVFSILLVPTVFMLLWLSVFGGIALQDLVMGSGTISAQAQISPELTFFAILEKLPLTGITTFVTLILIIMFLVTTVTSASLSLSRMTDLEGKTASPLRSFVWTVLVALIAVAAIVASQLGGNDALNGIRALATTMAFPYLFFFLLTLAALIKQIRIDFSDGKE